MPLRRRSPARPSDTLFKYRLLSRGLSVTRASMADNEAGTTGQEATARQDAAAAEPRAGRQSRWYIEHTALLITATKWAFLGLAAGICVGLGTRGFLWALGASSRFVEARLVGGARPFFLLPIALPVGVWLIRTFAPTAKGHGT